MNIFGFDPGGGKKFGCAFLDTDTGYLCCRTVKSVDEAAAWATTVADGRSPTIAGIDTLLFWQSTQSGWRGADLYLRQRYPACRNSVLCANGLYGAMAVQGAVLAHRLRQIWTKIKLTETHPKVLWHHLHDDEPYPRKWDSSIPTIAARWLLEQGYGAGIVQNEDEFDAVLSAWSAKEAALGKWSLDLATLRSKDQVEGNVTLVSNINYYWPS